MLRDRLIIIYILVLIILISVFLLFKFFILAKEDKPKDYFPHATMVKSFKGQLNNDEFTQTVDKFKDDKIQIKQSDDYSNVIMIYEASNDMIRLIYTSLEEEFKGDYLSNLKENRHDIIIKTPLEVGTSWTDDSGGVYGIIQMDSIVKTPAGKFQTMVIEYSNEEFNVREYYAKNIGLVKIVINNYLVNELVDFKIID